MRLERILLESIYPVGEMLRDCAFDYSTLDWKGKDDPVTNLDKEAEWEIKNNILLHTKANFLGEEEGYEDNGANLTFIIDPIDGTKSFIRRDFHSSISVAVEDDGKLIAGCVYDFMRDIMYLGTEVNKMLYQGEEINIDRTKVFSKYRIAYEKKREANHPDIAPVRRIGSIALSLVQLAFGNFDGIIGDGRGNIWDIAAGYHILKNEKRFHITDYRGDEFDYMEPKKGLIALGDHIPDELRRCIIENRPATL